MESSVVGGELESCVRCVAHRSQFACSFAGSFVLPEAAASFIPRGRWDSGGRENPDRWEIPICVREWIGGERCADLHAAHHAATISAVHRACEGAGWRLGGEEGLAAHRVRAESSKEYLLGDGSKLFGAGRGRDEVGCFVREWGRVVSSEWCLTRRRVKWTLDAGWTRSAVRWCRSTKMIWFSLLISCIAVWRITIRRLAAYSAFLSFVLLFVTEWVWRREISE